MSQSIIVRAESPADCAAIHKVQAAAFPSPAEADLVDALRNSGRLTLSLIAEYEGAIVGHVAFSPVTVDRRDFAGLGLAPVGVLPDHQRQGIGGMLIRAGLDRANQLGFGFVVLLGSPNYYPRFGFTRASLANLGNVYGADAEFMVQELKPNSLPSAGGLVEYAPEFAAFED